MTFTTYVQFLDPVNPEAVMGAVRAAFGIPVSQPIQPAIPHAGGIALRSQAGGYRAAVRMEFWPDGQPVCEPGWCDDDGDCHAPRFLDVSFDTAGACDARAVHRPGLAAIHRLGGRAIWRDDSRDAWQPLPQFTKETR